MKKTISLILCLFLVLGLVACTKDNTDNNEKNNNTTENNTQKPNNGVMGPISVSVSEEGKYKYYTFSRIPVTEDDIEDYIDFKDPYQTACAILFTLARFENDQEESMEMLDEVMGPEEPSAFDRDFLKNQFEQYPYVIRSYFETTSPENNYAVENPENGITIKIFENDYSHDEEGYVTLWLTSSGADSERSVKLRQKGSTQEWFLFSDTYKGLCAGIRQPAENDKWN